MVLIIYQYEILPKTKYGLACTISPDHICAAAKQFGCGNISTIIHDGHFMIEYWPEHSTQNTDIVKWKSALWCFWIWLADMKVALADVETYFEVCANDQMTQWGSTAQLCFRFCHTSLPHYCRPTTAHQLSAFISDTTILSSSRYKLTKSSYFYWMLCYDYWAGSCSVLSYCRTSPLLIGSPSVYVELDITVALL